MRRLGILVACVLVAGCAHGASNKVVWFDWTASADTTLAQANTQAERACDASQPNMPHQVNADPAALDAAIQACGFRRFGALFTVTFPRLRHAVAAKVCARTKADTVRLMFRDRYGNPTTEPFACHPTS